MLTHETLIAQKDNLEKLAPTVTDAEIAYAVEWLKEKDDNVRYAAFRLLQILSLLNDKVFKHWDKFVKMTADENSYQRSLGLMLIAENVRWDKCDKFADVCGTYLQHCDDEKFITARQCIQGLNKILESSMNHSDEIIDALIQIDTGKRKDTQQNLLLLDIINVLGPIHKKRSEHRIELHLKSLSEKGNDKVQKAVAKLHL